MARNRTSRRDVLRHGMAAGALAAGAGSFDVLAAALPGRPPEAPDAAGDAAAADAAELITRPIPKSGERLPVIGLGTNNYSVSDPVELADRRAVLERMPQLGGTLIDTAPAYGESEAVLGALIDELGTRDEFFLATKVMVPGDDPEAAREQMKASHERLRTRRIDLLQLHNLRGVDELMPLLVEAKEDGRVRYVGITTSNPDDHGRLAGYMRRVPLDFIQVDYSLDNRSAAEAVLPLAADRGIAVLVNMPFGGRRGGNLFGQLSGREPPEWAAGFGATTWGQVLLKYIVGHPAVTCAIPGTTKLSHLEDNQQAARGRLPTAEERRRLEKLWDSFG